MITVHGETLRLAAVIESSDDAIVSQGLDGTIETWNKAAERIFGYTAAEAIGQSIELILPAEELQHDQAIVDRLLRGEQVGHFESVATARDGTTIPVSVSISPVVTPDGQIIALSRIARDISRQKALEREAFRLAAIVDSSEDAIVSKDLNGIVQTWNKAAERMFGYAAEEIVGRPITLIIPPDRLPEEAHVLSRIRAGLSIDHFETIRRRKDGSLIEISLTVSPIKTPDGHTIGASKIARDLSAQVRLAREAEEANRVKDEFLAMLSHELRTPLNAVLGYTRMLRMGHYGEGQTERAIDVIERNAKILSQLVSDVLDVSSIVTGKIRLNIKACDLSAVVGAAVDVVRPSAEAKGVRLEVDGPDRSLDIRCDPDRLQQVFWNLLSNAIKFTPKDGLVSVGMANTGVAARVTVTDTGIGLRPQILPFLFQRFWQAEGLERQHTGSLGLGLALARHFVELHGGTIEASSPGEGQGSTFTVTLPLSS